MGIVGWSTVAMAATTNTIIQLTVPDDLRGRVMSVYTTVFAGTTPIGSLLAGGLASRLGVGPTLVLAGAVTAGSTVVAALWATRRRRLPLWTAPGVVADRARATVAAMIGVAASCRSIRC